MTVISKTLKDYFKSYSVTRQTPSGWLSGNAPCCHHRGHNQDVRSRGGIKETGDTISFHCFNCGFSTSWQPGWLLHDNLRNLLKWLGMGETEISKLAFETIRLKEHAEINSSISITLPDFNKIEFPENTIELDEFKEQGEQAEKVKQYIKSRNLSLTDGYKYFWCSDLAYRDRFIMPFYYRSQLVGWTARSISDKPKIKYLMNKQPGYVFNLDNQGYNKVFCIVTEGAIDAIPVDGVALLTNEINEQQSMLLNRLNREIIVVPDRDKSGRNLVQRSIELGYSVSMPNWDDNIKDVSDAVEKYGQLYTLYSIVSSAESNKLKIQLKEKLWYKNL